MRLFRTRVTTVVVTSLVTLLTSAAGSVATASSDVVVPAALPGLNGRIAFEVGGTLYSADTDGENLLRLTTGTTSHGPRYSPDGARIAFHRAGDIWVMNTNGKKPHRVTEGAASDINPGWSPDGSKLVFSRSRGSRERSLYTVPITGGSATALTSASDGCAVEPTWTADGRYVVYWDQCFGANVANVIRKVRVKTGQVSTVVGPEGVGPEGFDHAYFWLSRPDVTPDSSRVVFAARNPEAGDSREVGIAEVDLNGRNSRWIVRGDSLFLYGYPSVSPDGRSVVYTAGNEEPQLKSDCLTAGDLECDRVSLSSHSEDHPLRPDWGPR